MFQVIYFLFLASLRSLRQLPDDVLVDLFVLAEIAPTTAPAVTAAMINSQ